MVALKIFVFSISAVCVLAFADAASPASSDWSALPAGGTCPSGFHIPSAADSVVLNKVPLSVKAGSYCVRNRNALEERGYGTGRFTDSRNGRTYSVVLRGDKIWMTENLVYDSGNPKKVASAEVNAKNCYLEDSKFCNDYGRYYTWKEAMNVCPAGWHLPDDAEWRDFQKDGKSVDWKGLGRGGCRDWDSYCDPNSEGHYWSSSSAHKGTARGWEFSSRSKSVSRDDCDMKMGMLVRCVQNAD